MIKLNYLLWGIIISSVLFISSCGSNAKKNEQKNTAEYNILASVENPTALFSIDIMDLLKKSNVQESKDMPAQFKMIVNTTIQRHFSSENQGFKLEGNIPFIVSSTKDDEFNYAMTSFDVLDAEKIGPSLCFYFNGKVIKEGDVSILEAKLPGALFKTHFVWDKEKLIVVATEKNDSKAIALATLANKSIDAPENEKISNFLGQDNDFSSLLYMDSYTKMVNKLSETTMSDELIKAYEGLTVKSSANFNNGEFIVKTDLEGENYTNSKFNNLNSVAIDESFYHYLTDNNQLIAYGMASLNIEAIVNTMNQTKSEYNEYESELNKLGIKKEDIANVLNGQFSASLIDVESIATEGYEGNIAFNQDRPKILITCGLKDDEKLNAILSNAPNVTPIEKYFISDDVYFGINDQKLFISLNKEIIQKLTTGEKLGNYTVAVNKPLYAHLITDLTKLPESYKSALSRNGGEEVLKFYNQLEKIEFSGDIHQTEFKIEFSEKSKNSFEVIANLTLENILPLLMSL